MSDRRAYEQEWLSQPGIPNNLPMGDPLQSAGIRPLNYEPPGRTKLPFGLYFGTIIEGFSYLNTYRVTVENGSIIQCVAGSQHSTLPFGTSSSTIYGPGQEVLVVLRASSATGVILCAVPREVSNPGDYRPDAIFSGSNVGYFVDPTSHYWTGQDTNDISDFSMGRPYDITNAPQEAVQGATGVGYVANDFMAAMKADEETGAFIFYEDSLARFTGRNLQIRAHGLECEWLNDEGELSGYQGRTPYFWEHLGAYQMGVQTSRHMLEPSEEGNLEGSDTPPDEGEEESDNANTPPVDAEDTPATVSAESPELAGVRYGFVQPVYYDQQPFHRITSWDGYLGQGGRKAIIVPGIDVVGQEQTAINTYSIDSRWLTLAAKQDTLGGNQLTIGSGDILFVKRPPQPTPKRKEKPESPLGDRGRNIEQYLRNYSPLGIPSSEEVEADPERPAYDHIVTHEVPITELPEVADPLPEEDPPVVDENAPPPDSEELNVPDQVLRAAAVTDELAYTIAWEGVHTFHYHKKDFFFPQESDLEEFNRSPRPPYESLADAQYLGQKEGTEYPEKVSVKVDHRYGEVSIYLNTAYFGLKKDGSWVLRSGCGCEMRSENGNWDISAPGDIRLRPGRNLIGMSGNDTVLKANKSIDITASNKDLRLAAFNNLMAVSAVSGEGVMLLQSNSECILDPEKENTIEPPDEEPENPEEPGVPGDPELPVDFARAAGEEEEEPAKPTYRLGEEVIGSGILFKSRKAQVTATGMEINLLAGMKEYEEPTTDENGDDQGDPAGDPEPEKDIDPETGETDEPDWTWKPGRIRIMAEKGQVETLSSYFINYVTDTSSFGSKSAEGADGKTGACLQVFMTSEERTTDEDDDPLPEELPPNILAAAGVADLSSTNTCKDVDRPICYRVLAVNEFRDKKSSICGQLVIGQELFVGGCAYVRGNLLVFDKIESNFEVYSFDGGLAAQRADVKALFDEADTRCLQLLPSLLADQAANLVNDPTGEWLDFSFRTANQYNTQSDFCLMENWWQHQVRVESEQTAVGDPGYQEGSYGSFFPPLPSGLEYWSEMSIETPYARQAATAPYPGVQYVYYDIEENEELADEERKAKPGYGVFELGLVDEEEGRPKDRNEPSTDEGSDLNLYETARLKRGTKISLGHYIVVDVKRPDPEEAIEDPTNPDDPVDPGDPVDPIDPEIPA